jgi:UDP-2,3-diacylglucosamine pyrophosphatase LpxH
MAPAAMKKIFISDIHLGDERSLTDETSLTATHPTHPYGWIKSNLSNLAHFLEEQADATDVAELVILGDLFDTWVIPTDFEPLTSFDIICRNPMNLDVINALKKLAAKGVLSYVPGNHDMALSIAGLTEIRSFMETSFPGINYICDPNLPTGVYRSGKLVAEHGNRYCLFNAPDPWTDAPSFLPIGYFISRLVAYKVSTTGTSEDFHNILKNFIVKLLSRPNFVKDLFEAIAEDAGLAYDSDIKMNGISNFPNPIKVGYVGSTYGPLIYNWEKDGRNKVGWETATIADAGDLSLAAARVYFSIFGSSEQNIVIFGHTHKADLKKNYILEASQPVENIHLDLPCLSIYANCGTWVDAVPSTYVETQEDLAAGRHNVRLLAYPSKTLLQEGFVNL